MHKQVPIRLWGASLLDLCQLILYLQIKLHLKDFNSDNQIFIFTRLGVVTEPGGVLQQSQGVGPDTGLQIAVFLLTSRQTTQGECALDSKRGILLSVYCTARLGVLII